MALARAVAGQARPGDMIGLTGELGAGKTRFVAGLADGLGAESRHVASPTFVLVHEYETPSGNLALVHIDAYRLHSADDLDSIGWDDDGADLMDATSQAVVAIEWADRLYDRIPPNHLSVHLDYYDLRGRWISMKAAGTWVDRIADLQRLLKVVVPAGRNDILPE